MSTNTVHNVLDRLKIVLNIKTDTDLATRLGVSPNTIATWKKRNSMDYDLIFSRSEIANFHWLLTGEGPQDRNVVSLDLLEFVVRNVRENFKKNKRSLSPEKEARLIRLLCEQLLKNESLKKNFDGIIDSMTMMAS